MQQLGAQDGTLAKAGAQGIGGTVQLFLFIGFGWIGEKIQLLKIVGAGLFGAHPNKAHWAVGPHLAHQFPRGVVNHIGRVGGAVQRYLVAAAAEGVIHQLMYEKHKQNPGDIVCIADSHTGTCGGYGQIGIGVGSTELAAAMGADVTLLNIFDVDNPVINGLPPVDKGDLIRKVKELTRDERLQNARGAFVCHPGADLTGKRVLLVDDIITTGATASACALALLQAGATDVTVAAVAVAEELPKEKRKKTK